MMNLFLSPQGRIPAGPFWQGVITLLVVGWVISGVQAYLAPTQAVSTLVGLLSLVLIYPAVCVYVKRFHDSGRSGWWYLAVIGIEIVFGLAVGGMLAASLIGNLQDVQPGSPEWQSMQSEMMRRNFLPAQAAGTVVTLAIAFVVSRLRSDPGENRFGPAPAGAVAA